jgi:hypothetical protein
LAVKEPSLPVQRHLSPDVRCRLGAQLLAEPEWKGKGEVETDDQPVIPLGFFDQQTRDGIAIPSILQPDQFSAQRLGKPNLSRTMPAVARPIDGKDTGNGDHINGHTRRVSRTGAGADPRCT